ncbi:MAG TPA: CocE/NonD family hydrolase C-terminal non-catalytic domain-containing protein, partial [Mesotoga infera]|nr:CocE/NonD family hydrolase C-terminal non-catalytic domain-containing protein [Mesotoga infera]
MRKLFLTVLVVISLAVLVLATQVNLSIMHTSDIHGNIFPVDYATGIDYWSLAEQMKDRATVEKRSDVLVYTTEVLGEEVEITGPIAATLYASSSAPDTDFAVTLVDVSPDGSTHLVQEGII